MRGRKTMRNILVGSRSFGNIVKIGEEILKRSGFTIRYVLPDERPLDEMRMKKIVMKVNPDVILCGAEPITGEVLRASQNLRMVIKHGSGVDNIDIPAATSLNIPVAYTPGKNTTAVADFTIALILNLLRGICPASHSTKEGGWYRFIGHDLGDMTIGIVGTGRVGQEVVKRLHGFGSKMLAYDVVPTSDLEHQYGVEYVGLDELLHSSDIVTLHVPLMDRTRGMIGKSELAKMKRSAYLLNLARGGLVDEKALYTHLKANGIAGAALDVYATEPPQNSPLLQLENVLATSHIAAYTYESMQRMDRACAETIIETFQKKISPNILNPETLDSFTP
jgi:D-3-phosphoglycerate dehydrogenase